jgi:hypothetical protein
VDTASVYRAGSSAAGKFIIPVPVGKYELTVSAPGFKKFLRQNLSVAIATAVRQDVALEVGTVTETVVVTETPPLLKVQGGVCELHHRCQPT